MIAGLPFTLSNLFPSLHWSPSPPPRPPETNQSGSMPLTRRRRCLPKGPRSSSDLEELGFVVRHTVSIFFFSILAYFYISRYLSLGFDSCSHPSTPLFVPLELVHRLAHTTLFSSLRLLSPRTPHLTLDLLMDLVVYGSHVYKTAIRVSTKSSHFSSSIASEPSSTPLPHNVLIATASLPTPSPPAFAASYQSRLCHQSFSSFQSPPTVQP